MDAIGQRRAAQKALTRLIASAERLVGSPRTEREARLGDLREALQSYKQHALAPRPNGEKLLMLVDRSKVEAVEEAFSVNAMSEESIEAALALGAAAYVTEAFEAETDVESLLDEIRSSFHTLSEGASVRRYTEAEEAARICTEAIFFRVEGQQKALDGVLEQALALLGEARETVFGSKLRVGLPSAAEAFDEVEMLLRRRLIPPKNET